MISSYYLAAYIKNEVSGTWNMFNDESVQKLEGKKLKIDEEDPECKIIFLIVVD